MSPQESAFWDVVEAARGLSDAKADYLQRKYERAWGWRYNRASARAWKIAEGTGRLKRDDHAPGSRWMALDELCGIVGGTTDIAVAELVRDLISEKDYRRLTGWAVA